MQYFVMELVLMLLQPFWYTCELLLDSTDARRYAGEECATSALCAYHHCFQHVSWQPLPHACNCLMHARPNGGAGTAMQASHCCAAGEPADCLGGAGRSVADSLHCWAAILC